MWLLPYSTKCGNIWSTQGYYQMWLLPCSTKCGNIWSTHGYYQMWLLLNIWSTHGYYHMWYFQMWQNLWILPNVATSDSTKCGNIWSTHGYLWLLLYIFGMFGHYWYFKCCHIRQYIEFHYWTFPKCCHYGVAMFGNIHGYLVEYRSSHIYPWVLQMLPHLGEFRSGHIW